MFQRAPGQRRRTFSVFHHTVALLLLTRCCKGQPQVIGPPQPIVASVGDDLVLPCHLEPATDVASTAVEWSRPDLTPRFVHVWRAGQELPDAQHPSYRGRTSLFISKLKHGDVSLKLSKVRLSDGGTYRCYIPILNRDSTVELVFGSVSSPDIDISIVSSGVLLECKSKGRYLEPEVSWLDAEGKLLSAGPPEAVRGPDGLYTVSSRVTVEERHGSSFTCRVQQKDISQSRETHVHVPADFFMVQSSSAVRITICSAVCLMSIVAVVSVVWKWGRNETKTTNDSNEVQPLMEGERERWRLKTGSEKMAHLDETKAKLDEELQKNEGELKHVEQVITTLRNQKKELKTQREKLNALQQDDKTQIVENNKKLEPIPTTGKEKKKKKREKKKQDLERRKTEHEELLKNTEKVLETLEDLIIRTTEWKGKLEKDKEQINKHLKETKREREELQRKLQSERQEEINTPSSNGPV